MCRKTFGALRASVDIKFESRANWCEDPPFESYRKKPFVGKRRFLMRMFFVATISQEGFSVRYGTENRSQEGVSAGVDRRCIYFVTRCMQESNSI